MSSTYPTDDRYTKTPGAPDILLHYNYYEPPSGTKGKGLKRSVTLTLTLTLTVRHEGQGLEAIGESCP